jgi:hypothetical protein
MPIFVRRATAPPAVSHYRDFRDAVREDFSECCAYCLLSEQFAAGSRNFELDHFKPKSVEAFKHLERDFFNLYYSCHPCNQNKGPDWPSPELIAAGYGFVDYCRETFADHFDEGMSGEWSPTSKPGHYTARRLRLNNPHLVGIRGMLNQIADRRGLPRIDWNRPARDTVRQLMDFGPGDAPL